MVFIGLGLLGKHSWNKFRNHAFAPNGLIRGLPEIVFLRIKKTIDATNLLRKFIA
jgi:hypothetical protein